MATTFESLMEQHHEYMAAYCNNIALYHRCRAGAVHARPRTAARLPAGRAARRRGRALIGALAAGGNLGQRLHVLGGDGGDALEGEEGFTISTAVKYSPLPVHRPPLRGQPR